MTTPAPILFLQIGKRRYQVASLEQASFMFCAARDEMDRKTGRASKMKLPNIVDEAGTSVARLSYNGRVWPVGEWTADMAPLYDNRVEA
ncbi:hypothetical protein [Bradyrhizobium sp.]